ncbi:hypothetical protein ACIOJF_15045 [Glutamicibacter sp. NPDC087831]|uniref:hypothetical protein n=1 Tax=Glutamicibacter sp. NPDC087831 TaxID=3363998 RepID=UPI00381BC833
MIATTATRPAITPQSPKEPNKIEAGITRAEIEEYFLYDSINPANRKRRMSRRMATHLRKMVSQSKHVNIAKAVLPPGWFEAIHRIEPTPELLTERTVERHREVVAARHEAVMRLVALEQAKSKAGANR